MAPVGTGYSPEKPTLLFVHGWEHGTLCRGMRESFNWKSNYEWADYSDAVDIDACDFWIERGWNVCVFYWDQISDTKFVTQAEKQIYSQARKWHVLDYKDKKNRWKFEDLPAEKVMSVADMLAEEYIRIFKSSKEKIVVVGHSLGSQLVLESMRRLCKRKACALPHRVVLCDAFFSKGGKHYLKAGSLQHGEDSILLE